MATIRKHGNKYQVRITKTGYKPMYRSFHTRKDALEWSRHTEVKLDRGDLPDKANVIKDYTVKDIIERYLQEVTVKKKSADSEAWILKAFIKQSIASLSLLEVNTTHFNHYKDKRLKVVKAGTVNREFSIIKHAFDMAIKVWGIPIKVNPLDNIKKLRVSNARNRRLEGNELDLLMTSCARTRNIYIKPIIKFALATAMRRGELLSLKWSDIDLDKKLLNIPVAKNGYARTIPLSRDALDVLDALKERCSAVYVFPISKYSVRMAWDRLIVRAGIDNLNFHDLRHEAISRLFEKGLSIPEVALISGHRDYKMLFRYTHLRAEDVLKKI